MTRILFTGGGTGGHIYPILAVAQELKKIAQKQNLEIELIYLGALGNFSNVFEENEIYYQKIISAKLRRYFDLRNIIDIPLFFVSLIQAFLKVFLIMPDVLFSKGGPGSLPVVLACWFFRVPIIVHESDAVPGLANQLSFKFAKRIGISFELAQEAILKRFSGKKREKILEKIALIGNPIRPSLFQEKISQDKAKEYFGFKKELPTIFVIGGSQGSVRINDLILDSLTELIYNYQIIHQTGKANFEEVKQQAKVILENLPHKERYKPKPYLEIEELKIAYSAADLIVARAGSGTIFEIAAFSKPAILIPLKGSANNHQLLNAYEFFKKTGAIVIEEENLSFHIFIDQLKNLFNNKEKLKTISEKSKEFFNPEAAKIIAEEILKLAF